MSAKTLIALSLAASLAACSTVPAQPEPLPPVRAYCPAPVLPARPVLPVERLAKDATVAQVAEAYARSLQLAVAYSLALEDLLRAVGEVEPVIETENKEVGK